MFNMNPKQMEQMMRKMGINQKELTAKKVIIELDDKKLIFINPQVSKVNLMGHDTYQVVGEAVEEQFASAITDEDIKAVMEQANVDNDSARKALENNDGDIAKAILSFQSE